MKYKKWLLPLFVLVALVQLYVPAKMIWDKEEVLSTGKEYKFKTRPVDPTDPFRGKYITLDYEENQMPVSNVVDWKIEETIYVHLTNDKAGYAKVHAISKEKPTGTVDFVKAKITGMYDEKVTFWYPFDRYYMEESKAYPAEQMTREARRDTTKTTYALVVVKQGESVLKDVMIDGQSIQKLIENQRQ